MKPLDIRTSKAKLSQVRPNRRRGEERRGEERRGKVEQTKKGLGCKQAEFCVDLTSLYKLLSDQYTVWDAQVVFSCFLRQSVAVCMADLELFTWTYQEI